MADHDTYYGGTDAPLGINQLRGGQPNVGQAERWLSAIAGGALATVGVRRGGVIGTLATVAGAALVARGAAGQDPVKRVFTSSPAERALAGEKGWPTAATAGFGVTINKPRQELYDFWRDFTNLPKFMENVTAIEVHDHTHSTWHVKGPGGMTAKWDSVITQEEPGHKYQWDSPTGDVRNAGWVTFKDAPGGRGTEVRLTIAYVPPMGQFGRIAAKVARREPAIQARMDLKRFKMLMETGEVSTAKLNPTATNAA